VWLTRMYAEGPRVPELRLVNVEVPIKMLGKHISLDIDQIMAEFIRTVKHYILKFTNY
jgi:hypothetical protein